MLGKVGEIKRGDIFYADLGPTLGCEQGGKRPVIIVQNNMGNKHAPTVMIAPLTTRKKNLLPTHIEIEESQLTGVKAPSIVLLEQVRTIDKQRMRNRMGMVPLYTLEQIDKALKVSLGLL
jgi:Growth inhibitor